MINSLANSAPESYGKKNITSLASEHWKIFCDQRHRASRICLFLMKWDQGCSSSSFKPSDLANPVWHKIENWLRAVWSEWIFTAVGWNFSVCFLSMWDAQGVRCWRLRGNRLWFCAETPCQTHTWYFSQISQIRYVEKNLSCGEISDLYAWYSNLYAWYSNHNP